MTRIACYYADILGQPEPKSIESAFNGASDESVSPGLEIHRKLVAEQTALRDSGSPPRLVLVPRQIAKPKPKGDDKPLSFHDEQLALNYL